MLIWWLLATEGTRRSHVRCLHSDRGGEFRSGVRAGFCGEKGIKQSWTLPESPQQNGVAECRIGLVMDIARTSMIHARAPHFLWPYTLHYAAHQLNLLPCVSRPEVSPTCLWTRSPGVGSAFHVWCCLALVHDTSADKLSARAILCVFLGFPVGSPNYSFYHPPLHQFLDSRDVWFDESVSYYSWYPCRGLPVPPPPLFLAPSPPPAPAPPVPPPPSGPAPSGVSHATPLPSIARQVASPSLHSSSRSLQQPSVLPRQVTVDSVGVGAGGAATGGLPVPPPPLFLAPSPPPAPAPPVPPPPSGPAPSGVSHATPLPSIARQVASPSLHSSSRSLQQPSVLPRQVTVDSVGVGAGGAATGGTRSGGAHSRGARAGGASSGGARAGGTGTGGASFGGAGVGGPGSGGARTGGAGARDPDPVGTPSGDTGSGGASSEATGAGGTTSAESTPPPHRHNTRYQAACRRAREEQERLERERQELRQLNLLKQQQQRQQQQQQQQQHGLRALGLPSSPPVRPSSPAFGPTFSPPDARPVVWSSPPPQSPPPVVRHYRSRPCPPSACPSSPITDLHTALLCTSLRRSPPPVSVLPSPPPTSLPVSPNPIADYYRGVRPVDSRVLATGVTNPRFSPSSVSALTAAVADFAAASRLDYSTRVVPAPPTRPLSVGDPNALDTWYGGARSRGARFGGAGAGGVSSGGAGAGGAGTEETGAGGLPTASPTAPAGAAAAAAAAAADAATATFAAAIPSSEWPSGPWSAFLSSCSLPVIYCIRHCPPRARPLSPLADLRPILFRSPPRRSPPRSVLPSSPESSLTVSSHPINEYYRVARPVVSRVLASHVTDPRASLSSVSALTAAVADFASTRRLDYATRVVAAPTPRPLYVGGESDLGCDVLEDRQFELEFLAAASPSLCAMLLSLEGDPDALDIPTPRTYREAVSGEWASQWKAAMDAELASWRSAGTYVDVVPPPRANVVDGMWLFKVKRPPGSLPVFKVRYVGRGFSQRKGFEFFQTFAPTPKMTTLRVLLHVASHRDYELHSLDFSTAFLQGRLHEEIWLRRPPGFTDTFPPGTQWRLRRPVYGLRQSPGEWHDTLRSTLRDLGFRPSSADPSLFVRTGSTPFFVLVYVDDLVLATADRVALTEVKSELQKRHKCTDLGELQRYLGLQVIRGKAARTITLTQSHMVQQVLRRVLSHFVATRRHHPVDWTAAVRAAKYLATTSGMGPVLGGTQPVVLTGHCDSSYADDVETQRLTQGYCFSLGAGAVSWRYTRSSSVAWSSAEAEIYAGAMAAQELRWLTFLLADLG
ncbi:unnamed protein product [Closterium sp. NIES-54]